MAPRFLRTSTLERVSRDVASTIGPGLDDHIRTVAEDMTMWPDASTYEEEFVSQVQQVIHDLRIDVSWPRCPKHADHPMWYSKGWWHADGSPYARLGEL